ncbi:hypothetical protein [Kitasatospora purpeofusca]
MTTSVRPRRRRRSRSGRLLIATVAGTASGSARALVSWLLSQLR